MYCILNHILLVLVNDILFSAACLKFHILQNLLLPYMPYLFYNGKQKFKLQNNIMETYEMIQYKNCIRYESMEH